jgi:hypothetical protein
VKEEYQDNESKSYEVVAANILTNEYGRNKSGQDWGPGAVLLDDNYWIVWFESMFGDGSYAAFSQKQKEHQHQHQPGGVADDAIEILRLRPTSRLRLIPNGNGKHRRRQ